MGTLTGCGLNVSPSYWFCAGNRLRMRPGQKQEDQLGGHLWGPARDAGGLAQRVVIEGMRNDQRLDIF